MVSKRAVTTASLRAASNHVEGIAHRIARAPEEIATAAPDALRGADIPEIQARMLRAIRAAVASLPALRRELLAIERSLVALVGDIPPEPELREGTCAHCGEPFPMRRSDARYCSPAHRVAAKRLRDRT